MKQCNNRKPHHGFTLLELLIVIAILGILAVGVVTAINVIGNLNKASLARAKTFSSQVENALSINQVGKWSFDDSASPYKDTSGNGNDGTINGSAILREEKDCIFRKCLEFVVVSSYINVPDSPSLKPSGGFTAMVWFNADDFGDWNGIISKLTDVNGGTGKGFNIQVGAMQNIASLMADSNGAFLYLKTSWKPSKKTWYHVVFVHNSNDVNILYVNGKKEAQNTHAIAFTDNPFNIGKFYTNDGGMSLDGLIDEVSIYNESLTLSQIQQLYAQGLPRHQLARQ